MVEEFNRGDNTGSAYFHVNQRDGLRWSMADAFLHPVAHRTNLSVRTHSAVQRLTFADDDDGSDNHQHSPPRVTGVEWVEGGHVKRAVAAREVILCSGAVASPQLLQASEELFARLIARSNWDNAGKWYRATAGAAGSRRACQACQ